MSKAQFVSCIFLLTVFSSCKKDVEDSGLMDPALPISAEAKIKDSVLLFSQDLYLWNEQIPSGFDARSFAGPEEIMEAIRAYSQEPDFSEPVDRWSFAYKQAEWDDVSAGILQDFGLQVFFFSESDLRVKSVEKSSPAGQAGIRRGWRVTKINGNDNITTANSAFVAENVFDSESTRFSFMKPDGSLVEIVLNAGTYQEDPIFLDTVYTNGAKKTGYLVFNSFLGDTSRIYNQFQTIFDRFSRTNITDLVVDLRYNGGGYVNVQEKLANYLVAANANTDIMMRQEFNNKYTELSNTARFSKLGTVNLNRLFFLVSKNTASASELLINNLIPYMDITLIGPGNTYGKPVGFFPIPVGDWYIFPVSFRSTNKNGEGNYFAGLPVDNIVADGLNKDWGDRNESCLASALKYIESGSFARTGNASTENSATVRVTAGNASLDRHSFKGAIDGRGIKIRK